MLWIAVNYIYLLISQFQFPHMQRHRLLGTFCGELLDCDIIEVERKGLPALREIWLSAPQGRLWFFLSFLLASVVIYWLCCEGVRIEWMHLWIFLLWCSVKITKLCRRIHDQLTGLNIMFTNCYWTPGHEITEAIFCICFCCVESKGNLFEITAQLL